MASEARECARCGITDTTLLDLDTGSACHEYPSHCIALLRRRVDYLAQIERQWIAECDVVQQYCRKHGVGSAGDDVFLVMRDDAERLRERLAAVEREREAMRGVVEAAVAYCHPPESDPWGYGDDERYSTLRDRVQDFVDLRAAAQTGNGGGE